MLTLFLQAHSLVLSRNCDGILVSPMREEELRDTTVMVSLAIVIGASVVFVVLLIAVMSLAFYRYRVAIMMMMMMMMMFLMMMMLLEVTQCQSHRRDQGTKMHRINQMHIHFCPVEKWKSEE